MLRRGTDFKVLWLLVFVIAIASLARSQRTGQAQTLVVAEFKPIEKGVGDYTELYAYRFSGGVLESRRLLWGGPMHSKGNLHYSIRFDLGHNFIHSNRYAVSGTGNVIDLRTGRVLTDFGDEFITAGSDSMVFHRRNIDIGTGYLRLDLPGGQYGFDRSLSFPQGKLSPDRRHGLVVNRQQYPYSVEIIDSANRICGLVRDAGTGTRTYGSDLNDVPLIWTGNRTFAYARCRGQVATIYEYELKSERASRLGSIQFRGYGHPSDFSSDCVGNTIFECSKGQFQLDRAAGKLKPYLIRPLGHDFQTRADSAEMQPLYFQGRDIGSFRCSPYNAQTSRDYLAIAYSDPGRKFGGADGFKVWSHISGKWSTFRPNWFCSFVGWVEE